MKIKNYINFLIVNVLGGHIRPRPPSSSCALGRALVPEPGGLPRAQNQLPGQHGRLQPGLPRRAAAVPPGRAPGQEGRALRRQRLEDRVPQGELLID